METILRQDKAAIRHQMRRIAEKYLEDNDMVAIPRKTYNKLWEYAQLEKIKNTIILVEEIE